jgi:hypothetical protein
LPKKALEEKLDALVADHHQAKDRLAALEAELNGIDEKIEELDWSAENVEASTQAALELDGMRRLALPRAIRAAKLAELAAREAVLEARERELEERRGPAVEALREAGEQLQAAERGYREAKGRYNHLIFNEMSDLRTERRRVAREQNSVESEPVQPRGLPVFSVWQENSRPNPDDPGLSGDSPATGWGVANVNDRPLSEGSSEGDRSVAVVPKKALGKHAKKPRK